jgi:hypothetical protein
LCRHAAMIIQICCFLDHRYCSALIDFRECRL